MLLDLIRRVVPIKYRQSIGLWTARQASRSRLLLYPYFLLLCGIAPENVELLPGDDCVIRYRGYSILSPKDGIFTSWEVLQDGIYEKFGGPREGDTVVDIGAYVGMFTVKAAQQVGPNGLVVAIEPSSSNLQYLRRNTADIGNVKVIPKAAGSSGGEGRLTTSEASPCHTLVDKPGATTETIMIDTLDDILAKVGVKKVDFIKIDAEGYELEILKGASSTLKQSKLRLAVASYHDLPTGEHELSHVCRLLVSTGFSIKVVKGYVYAEN